VDPHEMDEDKHLAKKTCAHNWKVIPDSDSDSDSDDEELEKHKQQKLCQFKYYVN
jgi:hypothetical protein